MSERPRSYYVQNFGCRATQAGRNPRRHQAARQERAAVSRLRDEPAPRRILVVRLGAMGDVIHTLPAVSRLKRALPDSEITWAIEPRWAPLLAGNPHIDRVLEIPLGVWRRQKLSCITTYAVPGVQETCTYSDHKAAHPVARLSAAKPAQFCATPTLRR